MPSSPVFTFLFLLFLEYLQHVVAAAAGNCTSFRTNGSIAATFTNYRFFDFRYMKTLDRDTSAVDNAVSRYSNGSSWGLDWTYQSRFREPTYNGTVPVVFSPENVKLGQGPHPNTTALTLTTARNPNGTQTASSLEFTTPDIHFLSIRMLARVTGSPGACAALFTYANDTQESDIEILTRDASDLLSYNNQPTQDVHGNAVSGASLNVSMPRGRDWTGWNVYRMDWTEGRSAWFVNGGSSANSSVNVPVVDSRVYVSMWGDGGSWSRNMTVGGSATLEVQWIEMAYNRSSGGGGGDPAGRVCDIDGRGVEPAGFVGAPVPDERSSSAAASRRFSLPLLLLFGLSALAGVYLVA